MPDRNPTKRRNEAIYASRLFSGLVEDRTREHCHQCGELLHPYPEPEQWMETPLPMCCVVDGLKICDDGRKPECLELYLESHPMPEELTKRKAQDERIAALAASLPDDRSTLLDVAAEAVKGLHEAVLNGANLVIEVANDRYNAAVWKLNGGTFFACQSDDDAAGRVIERHCRAVPGDVPMWGQTGEFLIEVSGVRAVVDVSPQSSLINCHFAFQAVDLDSPFVSGTGYRSHYDTARRHTTVDQVARNIMVTLLAEKKKLVMIEDHYRDRLAETPLPAWLTGLIPPARREPATVVIPPGFVVVDVVLPAHKAFLARRWAADAEAKIEAAKRLFWPAKN